MAGATHNLRHTQAGHTYRASKYLGNHAHSTRVYLRMGACVGARQPAVTCSKEQRAVTITLAHHRFPAKTSPNSARTSGSEPRRCYSRLSRPKSPSSQSRSAAFGIQDWIWLLSFCSHAFTTYNTTGRRCLCACFQPRVPDRRSAEV